VRRGGKGRSPPVLRVVIDTNVLVSSVFGGKPNEVVKLWRDQQLVLCLSDEIVAEYLEVLARFGDVRQELLEFLATLSQSQNAVFVVPGDHIQVVVADPEDDKFLECAVAAGAQAIVSGDRHLLDLGQFRGILIMAPAAFLAWFRARQA